MTDGSLKLNETDRTSRSYTEMTSTFPWHQRVIAFCQWTTFSGSYVALRRSVCSINLGHFDSSKLHCQAGLTPKRIVYRALQGSWCAAENRDRAAWRRGAQGRYCGESTCALWQS